MYSVFGDESADESKTRVFAVAGVFGSDSDWSCVKDAWLNRTGGKIFHASECETSQGDFANTDPAENKKLYKDLTLLICASRLMGRAHAIDLAGWREFFPGQPEDIPYLTCFRNTVQEAGNLASLCIPQDTVEFTFDQRPESEYNAGILYSYMAQSGEWRASVYLSHQISFGSRNYIGVQVADLIARETMKHLDNMIGPVKRDKRRSFAALEATERFRFTYWMREWFEGMRHDFEQLAGSIGVVAGEYQEWLKQKGLVDNISNRHRHMIEKFPPGKEKVI